MKSWSPPFVPTLPGTGRAPEVHDVLDDTVRPVTPVDGRVSLYVCGVTPYDTTHMGHAATYVTFDLLHRAALDAGLPVDYVQNVTDVDDPLLERAARDGIDWRDLAVDQTALFHEDMTALRVIPPKAYVGVVEAMPTIVAVVERLVDAGVTYGLTDDSGATDSYLDLEAVGGTEGVSVLDEATMLEYSAERGGDPDRPGKRGRLDPMLWRGHRDGEPSWESERLGPGRPGWHIECTAIAMEHLGDTISVQGGGSDLVFPHHPMTAVQAVAATGRSPFAAHTTHQAMVGLDGEKMSKSKGNLVRVSDLRREGVDPAAIRLVLLAHHYRTEWSWTDDALTEGRERLARWRAATALPAGPDAAETLAAVRAALAADLGTPAALAAVDAWCAAAEAGEGSDAVAPGLVRDTVDALLGVAL
ncbi:cysteine--1-D-myo-inosityl 2-amino-2-deoxy-alpha-D-glucopyranoside ligase [Janibacter sp. YIM B02568]|uniref:cysteine--1-D-myo-inosityl 2-amino-2-deoxy-alpha-D-glucopyranoside ligase n=1 Tax=Janibacter endophyticus TaxID=2806261 RepID=UPI00195130F4|nr:cysteine--1-D-myo-inosityl 2-amino-2-deoxy-alpha-D-glucopyranoside ligase [Janibacter endophyticus]MBM6546405.1 cysteine--1-D-myo-inosityl 2-amino-2-deoxy-alpha-D-glucopyranoside ligase [Janibacter endophyticus]